MPVGWTKERLCLKNRIWLVWNMHRSYVENTWNLLSAEKCREVNWEVKRKEKHETSKTLVMYVCTYIYTHCIDDNWFQQRQRVSIYLYIHDNSWIYEFMNLRIYEFTNTKVRRHLYSLCTAFLRKSFPRIPRVSYVRPLKLNFARYTYRNQPHGVEKDQTSFYVDSTNGTFHAIRWCALMFSPSAKQQLGIYHFSHYLSAVKMLFPKFIKNSEAQQKINEQKGKRRKGNRPTT